MDAAVLRSLARWPDVPAVFDWLLLDARGNWLLRMPDGGGRFERIANPRLREFIARNYGPDRLGRWYFQNGPQRVYVRLERTPLVLSLLDASCGDWADHCGRLVGHLRGAWLDERGALLLQTASGGVGVVDDRELDRAADRITVTGVPGQSEENCGEKNCGEGAYDDEEPVGVLSGSDGCRLPIRRIRSGTLEKRFGFVAVPQPNA